MLKKSQTLGKLVHTIYAIIAVVAIVPLIILWSKANIVGMLVVACIVFLPIVALWIGLRKRSRNITGLWRGPNLRPRRRGI
jgi:ABC-type nitrate/sulfonate/bicarbonate transport system permease component